MIFGEFNKCCVTILSLALLITWKQWLYAVRVFIERQRERKRKSGLIIGLMVCGNCSTLCLIIINIMYVQRLLVVVLCFVECIKVYDPMIHFPWQQWTYGTKSIIKSKWSIFHLDCILGTVHCALCITFSYCTVLFFQAGYEYETRKWN